MQKSGVLIVEHDDRVCRVLCRIVKRMGYEPFAAADYEVFKALYVEKKPAIILLDMEIPGSDNSEFFRYLVEQQSQAAIFLLSDLEENETRDYLDLGASAGLIIGGILRKPVDFDSVKQKLTGRRRDNQDSPLKKSQITGRMLQAVDRRKILDPDQRVTAGFSISFEICHVV